MATIPSGHGLKHKLTLIFQPYPVPIISSRTDDFIYHNHIEFEVIGIWHLNSNVNILVFKKEKKLGGYAVRVCWGHSTSSVDASPERLLGSPFWAPRNRWEREFITARVLHKVSTSNLRAWCQSWTICSVQGGRFAILFSCSDILVRECSLDSFALHFAYLNK